MCDRRCRAMFQAACGSGEPAWPTVSRTGRRQFVDVAENFPDECRYVLELLGQVYSHDAEARERAGRRMSGCCYHQDIASR